MTVLVDGKAVFGVVPLVAKAGTEVAVQAIARVAEVDAADILADEVAVQTGVEAGVVGEALPRVPQALTGLLPHLRLPVEIRENYAVSERTET